MAATSQVTSGVLDQTGGADHATSQVYGDEIGPPWSAGPAYPHTTDAVPGDIAGPTYQHTVRVIPSHTAGPPWPHMVESVDISAGPIFGHELGEFAMAGPVFAHEVVGIGPSAGPVYPNEVNTPVDPNSLPRAQLGDLFAFSPQEIKDPSLWKRYWKAATGSTLSAGTSGSGNGSHGEVVL